MRVKFISDGTREGTRLVNAETGEFIEGVESIDYRCSATDGGFLTVVFIYPDVDVKINDKTHGVVNFKRSYFSKDHLGKSKEELTDEGGKNIPGISEIKIIATLNSIFMRLIQKETFNDLMEMARSYRRVWDRPKQHEIETIKDLSVPMGV